MASRRLLIAAFLFAFIVGSIRADERFNTENFEVIAPTKKLAEQFGRYAEQYRRDKAMEWLGDEMPRWAERCPLIVEINPRKTGGATTFTFGRRGGISSQDMKIWGEAQQLLESVLPHEVTHTVLAHHFGKPVPRWADEGGSVLSENDAERLEHDIRCREFLNANRGIPLKHLFPMKEYPKDTPVLYAQGFSVTNYLVEQGGGGTKGRQQLLAFLETGTAKEGRNWDAAVKKHYGFDGVEDLQEKWIDSLRTPPVAKSKDKGREKTREAVATSAGSSKGTDIRSTASHGVPQLEPPVASAIRASGSFDSERRSQKPIWTAPAPPSDFAAPKLLPPEIGARR